MREYLLNGIMVDIKTDTNSVVVFDNTMSINAKTEKEDAQFFMSGLYRGII